MNTMLWYVVMIFVSKISFGSGNSILEIRFESYQNPSKSLFNRKCCVDDTSICRIDCSNTFDLCISSKPSTDSCDVTTFENVGKDKIGDDELFSVGGLESRFQNPIRIKLPEGVSKDTVYLGIKVYHKRTSLAATFNSVAINIDGTQSTWIGLGRLTSTDRRSSYKKYITLSAKTSCNIGFKGKLCDQRSCTPRDDDKGHYECTKDNRLVCLPGWMDPSTGCIKRIVLSTTLSTSAAVTQSVISQDSTKKLSNSANTVVKFSMNSMPPSLETSVNNPIKSTAMNSVRMLQSSHVNNGFSSIGEQTKTAKIPQLKTISTFLLKVQPTISQVTTPSSSTTSHQVNTGTGPTKEPSNRPKTEKPTTNIEKSTTEKTPIGTSERPSSNMFAIIMAIVLTVALVSWLIVLLFIRKRLIAKAKIRSIVQSAGSFHAPPPKECSESFTTTAPLTIDSCTSLERNIVVKETSLNESVPDR